jgi:exopolyphosphatase / guanosine-5'-triphosphate,3'-diphosphate pyrophosphatase
VRLRSAADLGTNTFRLLVAEELGPGRLRFRELVQEVIRLGAGLGRRGAFEPSALERAGEALGRFRGRLDALGVARRVGALTASGRDASDGESFRLSASALLQAEVRILSGEEEAALSSAGALSLLDLGDRPVLFLDIGGGSLEVAVRRGAAREPEAAFSIPTGVVKIEEAAAPADPLSSADRGRLEAAAREALRPVEGRLDLAAWKGEFARGQAALVAAAGTPLTAAAHAFGRRISEARALTGAFVSRVALEGVWREFSALTSGARARLPAVETGREDVILAGLALLRAFLDLAGAPGFTVSDGGLAEGLLLDDAAKESGHAAWVF